MPSSYYAHSLRNSCGVLLPTTEWEPLYTGDGGGHLERVARLAKEFAGAFGEEEWGHVAGLWHDVGKYSTEFQRYLGANQDGDIHYGELSGKVDHSTAGAQFAVSRFAELGHLLAYAIAGHHAGLPDRVSSRVSSQSYLDARLKKSIPNWEAAPAAILTVPELPIPKLSFDRNDSARGAFQIALWTRMLFSCLVDADFLATEAFMAPDKAAERPIEQASLFQMRELLDNHLASLASNREPSPVDAIRGEILTACRNAAAQPPGLFSLTVPTGGGKTFSSLAFALAHAEQHGLERVICAIPFTSIIEQTTNEYRKVFKSLGGGTVLEHHCNVDPDSKHETPQSRLAAENWDAPLVVTTNVQLFESLFASKTSRCRKLHRIVRSVIILDEAQTLPVELLKPCLAALRELAADYGCTVVLCTATQPALEYRDDFPIGLQGAREIIPEPEKLYSRMKRVEVVPIGQRASEQLAAELAVRPQTLCIVNTRPHAAKLFELLAAKSACLDEVFHLSTFMCGAHRTEVIQKIKILLDTKQPCRVVSTQLIEAGVDIDFPVVYRALSGIDSIAQAAGRCNREGKLTRGEVFVFEPTDVRLKGYLASTASSAAEVMPDAADLLDPEVIRRYFELHYWKQKRDNGWDERDVMGCFGKQPDRLQFQFRTAAGSFRFIEQIGKPVFVPYGAKGRKLLDELRAIPIEPSPGQRGRLGKLLRKLQRYTVTVYDQVYNAMLGSDIELLDNGYAVLLNESCYDDRLGFCSERSGFHEPGDMVV